MSNLEWHTEKRVLKQLIPLEKNPFGKIDSLKKQQLKRKLETLGIFEIPTVDLNNELLTFNKRYHILMTLGKAEEEIDVRVPNRQLTDEERKGVIISSNVHEGQWDKEILDEVFADIDLEGLGLNMSDFELPKELIDKEDQEEPAYPVIPQYSEKYDAIVIVSDNEIDTNFIKEVLELGQGKCYKSSHVGQTFVVKAKDFIKLWRPTL